MLSAEHYVHGLEHFRACYIAWANLTETSHIYVGLFSISNGVWRNFRLKKPV